MTKEPKLFIHPNCCQMLFPQFSPLNTGDVLKQELPMYLRHKHFKLLLFLTGKMSKRLLTLTMAVYTGITTENVQWNAAYIKIRVLCIQNFFLLFNSHLLSKCRKTIIKRENQCIHVQLKKCKMAHTINLWESTDIF